MSVLAPTPQPPSVPEREPVGASAPGDPNRAQGVIKQARRRRWRRHALVVALAALAFAGGVAAAIDTNGSSSRGELLARRTARWLAWERAHRSYAVSVEPELTAGRAGICAFPAGSDNSECGPYPSAGHPLFDHDGMTIPPHGRVPKGGVLETVMAGPGVAAVRVNHLGTFPVRHQPGLPAGDGAALFRLPAGAREIVVPPGMGPKALAGFEEARHSTALTLTALNAAGKPMPTGEDAGSRGMASRFWQSPEPVARGVCALDVAPLPGLTARFGEVATMIWGMRRLQSSAFLSCLSGYYTYDGGGFEVGVLLSATHPGSRPGALWGASAVPGRPGLMNVAAPPPNTPPWVGFRTRGEASTARREGEAWLVVRSRSDLSKRIAVLDALHVSNVEVRP
jgi:hypothetical protein